jgi:trk system potassium uptake protein TrkH
MNIFKKYGPYKLITLGFLLCIFIGSILLWLPISHIDGANVSYIDAFFTTVSAICVTGLASIDLANSFNLFGRMVVALLIQIGGLGVVCAAISIIIISGQKIGIRKRVLIMNSLNLNS